MTGNPDTEIAPMPAWRSLPDMFEANATRLADRVAVVDGPLSWSWSELRAEVRALARGLLAAGVQPGELVVCWAPNSARWVALAHAVWLVGGVVVPLSTRLKALEAGPILERTRARILFIVGEVAGARPIDMLREAYGGPGPDSLFQGLPALTRMVRMDADRTRPGEDGTGYRQFIEAGAGIPDARLEALRAAAEPDGVCEVMFTSGTTGSPKGVPLEQAQLMRTFWDWSGIAGLSEQDSYLVVAPFSHGFGLNGGVLASALRGMTMVLMDVFEPGQALALMERHGITVLAGSPNLFPVLIDHPARRPQSTARLRVAFIGAASVPAELIRRARSELGIRRVINSYGLIEGCVVSMTRAGDPEEVICTTTGRLLPGVELRIVDAEDRPLPSGQAGEILLRGFNVMKGYWNAPAETAAAFHDGWFRTGDIGVIDAAGNVQIVDRKKDMYICNGFNAYPAEIENLLLRRGGLSAVAVVGVPDPAKGEVGVAFAVPMPGTEPSEAELLAWAKANMANYKVPRRVFFRTSLPLNANGKVLKPALRQEALAAATATGSPVQ
jgi:acyl-CoA synthetase (AMP-forming)/AMP-acid ligase II